MHSEKLELEVYASPDEWPNEIDRVIHDLENVREILCNEGKRVAREIIDYANLEPRVDECCEGDLQQHQTVERRARSTLHRKQIKCWRGLTGLDEGGRCIFSASARIITPQRALS